MTKKPVKKAPAKRKKKQTPVQEAETFQLNQALAFSRVAIYLEEAGEVAVNSRSIEGMLTVAKGWLELADMMDSGHEPPQRAKLGFRPQIEEE